MSFVVVINYNTGNVDSIIKAVKLYNKNVIFTDDLTQISKASKIILPGQGSFDKAMEELERKKIKDLIIKKSLDENIPILGICLGMQVLASIGYENNRKTIGLNLIEGEVIKLKEKPQKLPHIGWNKVKFKKPNILFTNIEDEKDYYFIHSFKYKPSKKEHIIAESYYNETFPSIINNKNIYGIQFHPEKSLSKGLALIENFLKI